MKQNYRINVNLNEQANLKDLVENLASCQNDLGYSDVNLPSTWKALEVSSTQALVMGAFEVYTGSEKMQKELSLPFASSFLFTCIKEKCGLFNLEWSQSLS
jgi:hypothetical protein